MDDLLDIPHKQGIRLISFDIVNMYPYIPTNEHVPIIENMSLSNQLDAKTTNELTMITHTVLEQNYFTFRNGNYSQTTGLAMGAPSSAILSEIYFQHLEHTKVVDIITQQNIIGYFRYVDDILVVYDESSTDIHEVHKALNSLAPTIKFTLENEIDSRINFLDNTIQHKENKLLFNIYHKPTATDVIIPKDSCHPPEQKHAAIRHMINRMNIYRLNDDNKRTEHQITEQIIANNGYETSIIKQLNKPRHKDSWAKFTYFGRETRVITKLFKETQLRIAYKVNTTINKLLAPKPCNPKPQQQYQQSGVYSLTCPECHMKYVGQTSRHSKKDIKNTFMTINTTYKNPVSQPTCWTTTTP